MNQPKPEALCKECGSPKTMFVVREGHREKVIEHRDYCTQGDFCMQHIVGNWGYGTCGRPAKGHMRGGMPACGIHLRGERKEVEKEERREQRRELQKWIQEETKVKADKIHELLKMKVALEVRYWSGHGEWHEPIYTGRIIIDPDELLPLIEDEE